MTTYLEEDNICWWNALKHVTPNKLHVANRTGRSLSDNVREVQYGTLQTRKRRRNGHGGSPNPAGDVDQRVYPMEDLAELPQDNLHQEVAVCGHGVVEQRVDCVVTAAHLPQVCSVHQGERARVRCLFIFIMPEPRSEPHAERRVTEGAKHVVQHRRQARRHRALAAAVAADEEAGCCCQLIDRFAPVRL